MDLCKSGYEVADHIPVSGLGELGHSISLHKLDEVRLWRPERQLKLPLAEVVQVGQQPLHWLHYLQLLRLCALPLPLAVLLSPHLTPPAPLAALPPAAGRPERVTDLWRDCGRAHRPRQLRHAGKRHCGCSRASPGGR
jgi:hypothetical protein